LQRRDLLNSQVLFKTSWAFPFRLFTFL
jgi:hypothetical protein